ncbi:MAG: TerB family tellurite resistance protein [Bacillota bacterium]|nr:TerB family tellurite resistance protein [Bacillota bacterium]
MGWLGKVVGGALGFAVGGPVGAVAGAAIGNKFDKNDKNDRMEVICPYCNKPVFITGYGRWTCPHCNDIFNYYEPNTNRQQEQDISGNSMDVTCPYCKKGVLISGPGNWICPHCSETFSYNGPKSQEIPHQTGGSDISPLCSMFGMFEKIAKADGVISQPEISAIDVFVKEVLKLDANDRREGIEYFRQAKVSKESFEYYAVKFYEGLKNNFNPEEADNFFYGITEALFKISYADQAACPEQERMLSMAANIFNIDASSFNYIKEQYLKPDTDKYYEILGCTKNDSFEVVQTRYKALVKEYHPDIIASKNLPKDFIEYATRKFQDIQEAYEIVRRQYAR